MALNTYTEGQPRALFGGPRGRRTDTRFEGAEGPAHGAGRGGSHMPLDTDIHWSWRNPLNVIPAAALLAIGAAVIGMLLGG